MDRHPPATAELVERRELSRHHRRGDESRAMGDEDAQVLGRLQHGGGEGEAVRRGRGVADQHPVEAGLLMGAREVPDPSGIDGRAVDRVGLGPALGREHSEDLCHVSLLRDEGSGVEERGRCEGRAALACTMA